MTYIQPHVPEGHDVVVFYGTGCDTGVSGKYGIIDAETSAYVRFAEGAGHARDLQGAILGLPRVGPAATTRKVDFDKRFREMDVLARSRGEKVEA